MTSNHFALKDDKNSKDKQINPMKSLSLSPKAVTGNEEKYL